MKVGFKNYARGRERRMMVGEQSCRPDEQEGSVTSRDILSHTRRHRLIPQGFRLGYNIFEYKLDGPWPRPQLQTLGEMHES